MWIVFEMGNYTIIAVKKAGNLSTFAGSGLKFAFHLNPKTILDRFRHQGHRLLQLLI